jgi:hypothetical protein
MLSRLLGDGILNTESVELFFIRLSMIRAYILVNSFNFD